MHISKILVSENSTRQTKDKNIFDFNKVPWNITRTQIYTYFLSSFEEQLFFTINFFAQLHHVSNITDKKMGCLLLMLSNTLKHVKKYELWWDLDESIPSYLSDILRYNYKVHVMVIITNSVFSDLFIGALHSQNNLFR